MYRLRGRPWVVSQVQLGRSLNVYETEVELPCAPQSSFDSGVALLQGPRTLSRCLLEKVELERLAAAHQNSRGLRAAEDREPRGWSNPKYINQLTRIRVCASTRRKPTTMSSEPFYLRY